MRKYLLLLTCLALTVSLSYSQDNAKEAADYGISGGFSPFGLSLSMSYNKSAKTTFNVTLGGFPTSSAPFSPDIDGLGEYDLESGSSWMGIFMNHRPFEDSDWFRINTGIGIGNIENTITETEDGGGVYTANYKENPVGYVGVGFGQRPVKGFIVGFDVGFLFGAGPVISGPDAAKAAAIGESPFFGNVLPNLQLNLGYGF